MKLHKSILLITIIFSMVLNQAYVFADDSPDVNEFPTEYWEWYANEDKHKPIKRDDYYEVTSAEELAWISRYGGAESTLKIRIMNDIDLGGKLWTPLPRNLVVLNGQNHIIDNLTINTTESEQGLIKGGKLYSDFLVTDVRLTNVKITGSNYVGALIGSNSGRIINCSSSGYVSGKQKVGGLIGESSATVWSGPMEGVTTPIANCYVENCCTDTFVKGAQYVGGIIGYNSGSIKNCYSRGDVYNISSSDDYTTVLDSIASTGTILGLQSNTEKIMTNCYSTGRIITTLTEEQLSEVKRSSVLSGALSDIDGVFSNCCFDSESSGYTQQSSVEGITAKTSDEMKSLTTVLKLDKGNDEKKWFRYPDMNDGYPVLRWQREPETPSFELYTNEAQFTVKSFNYNDKSIMLTIDVKDFFISDNCYICLIAKDSNNKLIGISAEEIWKDGEVTAAIELPEKTAALDILLWNTDTLEAYTQKISF